MEWLIVIVLIVASIALLMLEFLVFAGSGVAGILGGAGIVAGRGRVVRTRWGRYE